MKLHYHCNNCDAEFKIRHEMDDTYYEVNFCPFCGSDIENDEEFDNDIVTGKQIGRAHV